MKKKKLIIALACFTAYILLLVLLVRAESASSDASIISLGAAVWYSLVTMTTVGYGDLYPVTPLGQIIGVVFLILSTGFLTVIITAAVSMITGKFFPRLKLFFLKNKPAFVFSELTEESAVLAADILKASPDAVMIFPRKSDETLPESLEGKRSFLLDGNIEDFLGNDGHEETVIFIGDDGFDNYRNALKFAESGVESYAMTEYRPDSLTSKLHTFNRFDCCARLYWNERPAMKSDELIVIIGSGKYAEAILERAILVNIIAPEQSMAYHLFGDYGNFLSNHYCLSSVFSINGEDNSGKDRLFVHSGSWNAEPLLLAEADRIILCDSDCSANLDIFQQLKSFHCPRCRVDLLSPFTVEEAYTFGEYNELFTSDLVLREKLNRTARLMNDIYVKSSDGKAPSWEGLSEFKRQSNIAAADHLPVKVRLLLNDCEILGPSAADIKNAAAAYAENRDELSDMCRRIEHERWNRFHFMYNWSFSESRNDRERKHNDLKSFDELSPSEQAKDDFAWELIGLLSDN